MLIGYARTSTIDQEAGLAEAMEVTYADFTAEVAPKALTMAKFIGSIEKVANDTTLLPSGARKVPTEIAELAARLVATIRAA